MKCKHPRCEVELIGGTDTGLCCNHTIDQLREQLKASREVNKTLFIAGENAQKFADISRMLGARTTDRAEKAEQQLKDLWSNCKVILYVNTSQYLEHNPKAGKDSRALIEQALKQIAAS